MHPNIGLFERAQHWVLTCSSLYMAVVLSAFAPMSHALSSGPNENVFQNIEKLLKEGRHGEADKAIQIAQTTDRDHFRLRFLDCVLQAQHAAPKKAISCFQQWGQDFPNVPEAHNNIGVLYASMGMPVEARKWFEQGLKQQQTYAALHQNLLNLQAEMSRPAYAAALQLDMVKSAAQPQLIMLGRITSVSDQVMPVPSATVAAKAVAPASPKPSVATTQPEPVAALPMAKPKPAEASAVAPTLPSAKEPSPAEDSVQQARVREAVLAWASAWREKDVEAYLQFYAPAFRPGARVSRADWESQRRERISSKKQIQLELTQFKIQVSGATSKATFVQRYESGAVVTVSRKTLEMVEDKGRWLIVREWVAGS